MTKGPVGRISSRKTFLASRKTSCRGKHGSLKIVFVPISEGKPKVQAAYTVSKKCGGAVQRNHLKRRLRSLVRQFAEQIPPGAYVITTQAEAATESFEELSISLKECFEQVKRTSEVGAS